jgi:hypothetical protein
LRGTKQSVGMMKGCLKAFARKLIDCYARNDKAKNLISLVIKMMKGCLKTVVYDKRSTI